MKLCEEAVTGDVLSTVLNLQVTRQEGLELSMVTTAAAEINKMQDW